LLSVSGNITLPILRQLASAGIRNLRREHRVASEFARRLDVRCESIRQPINQLSGGNQQKALLASRVASEPRILVLHEPTRGVDIGARLEIHRMLRELAAAGMACLVVSSDVEEVVAVSDRVLVLRDGKIVDELTGTRKTLAIAVSAAARAESGVAA
jgi:ribose transport system ATP-binding protein